MKTFYIVGAGCGDPGLITVRGMELLKKADILIYAGSLVNPELVHASGAAVKLDSIKMNLPEICSAIRDGLQEDKLVVRLHSGDPALYGAIVEQMAVLAKDGISAEIVPGVSSLFGAAAALKTQLTLRGVSESVIITRPAGATLDKDKIAQFSRTGETLVIFLGTEKLREIMDSVECLPETPAAVVYHATWDDEIVVKGTVADIADKAEAAGITKTALIIIGKAVLGIESGFTHSHLYS
ncbi:MAG: cobalt-precorrin-4/precorrin-4 C(11)-methyltransferase [Methanocalculus sp. MSAO_Arc1]|uniref:cobalt-precorrin-4/precorrin-4 C(11)-methyltransferase n=1 Tax=Methanocalculus TaxID=71151 RepID=UPI000FECF70B|nr:MULTISPECIES: cobalt-precorrin-4/precorrin-4 C(11)-methyltransferase [unclassified Methanocalculus]MCP1662397.1 precorrin-4/cobalt-precorrin-4 C11-methyltransferase [Methanocalculus sp. AMF5]RQD81359.1 MAG: cobalt-precorrin-4/precorrin-4 C(11)-methyltransferase [Methanocalculus sp. MSAO_Arc1]